MYHVTVEAGGFQEAEVNNITVVVDQTARIDVVQKAGTVSETVIVTGNAVTLDTDSVIPA